MQELRPTAEWSEITVPQFVILKIQNTSISTEAKLQVYLGMEKPTNNTFGFFLTPGSSFDTLVGKNKVFVRSDSGATGGFAYADITNKLTPTIFETEHIVADIANSFTKYIQRAHTIVVQNISDKEITLAISNDTAMRDGFVIKPYQFIGMNISINSNIILYGEGAKASVFVTPSFDANGGINSEMMSVFEKYFGIIEIINTDYVPKAQHKNDLDVLRTALVKQIVDGLALKLDIKTFNEFLQSNTESLNGVVPLNKPTQFGPGVTGSENFRDEKFRVELFTTDPAINLDAIDGILINKVTEYSLSNNVNHLVTLKGMNEYIEKLNSKYIAIDGGDLQNPLASNILAGDGLAGSIAVSGPDEITKSGFYVTRYNIRGIEDYGAVLHIEDHVNVQTATQIAVSGATSMVSIRVKKVGTWGEWSTLLPTSNFDADAFLKIIGGNVTGSTRFSGSINVENKTENASKPYSMVVDTPAKATNVPHVDGIKVISKTESSSAVSIDMDADDITGLSVVQSGNESIGVSITNDGVGVIIESKETGINIIASDDSETNYVGVDVDLKRSSKSTGLDIKNVDNGIGVRVTRSNVNSDGVGIYNELSSRFKDKLVVSNQDFRFDNISSGHIYTLDSGYSSAMIIVDNVASFDKYDKTKLSLIHLINTGIAKSSMRVESSSSCVGLDMKSSDKSRAIDIYSDSNAHESVRIKHDSPTNAAVSIQSNGASIYASNDIVTDGMLVGKSFSGTICGLEKFDFDNPSIDTTNSMSIIGIIDNDISGDGKPEEGDGNGIHMVGQSSDVFSQIIMMNNKLFFRNSNYKFVEAWSTKDLSKDKVAGIRDITNGTFDVQISNTEDIVTAKNLRCRNLISVENVTGYYSDMRLKKDVRVLHGSLDKVDKINPVSYKPNSKALEAGVEDRNRLGFIAQNVQEVIPEAVERAPINDILGTDDYLTVDNNTLIPVMLGAIKELHLEIKNLKDELSKRGECKCCHQVEK